jgi:hypothetical protein
MTPGPDGALVPELPSAETEALSQALAAARAAHATKGNGGL